MLCLNQARHDMQPYENVRQLPQFSLGEAKGTAFHEEAYESSIDMMPEQRKTCPTCGQLYHVLDCIPCYSLRLPRYHPPPQLELAAVSISLHLPLTPSATQLRHRLPWPN